MQVEALTLEDVLFEELKIIGAMEAGEARDYIIPYSLEKHQQEYAKSAVIYKAVRNGKVLVGFVMLALDPDGVSVELRRIVVSAPGRGIGVRVLEGIRELCRSELGRKRIWLDVFETNHRARHVYEKVGYSCFGKTEHDGRTLLLYETLV
ncbi:GNAT family N-acetyltransferase [Halomonas sp. MCCC 1A17488]|uniref:GNAT family N-acetyltransferase n=1 Tax=Billgrantia sulfidoxydans TaxID=2733484 RepID=A0ABX7W1Z0_9GAMM|nr:MULTISPECIES: GNAT family N-acetyltransferase [Halomonas]MCE8016155.1 GNAT family N-acetyltransferase [Halomonas sp. MCCC 1A17488]MCG3239488.1 GNAT family N-acetyltransferase [Halomonas sp. MCCC 1A17488]QPP50589.1 GNAT family N-acetyltransferase [Halomonas sp. SS10-MC5]QTP54175.1 GNAT family N-acetyltransferase [Halomonas sulfidoxydans]